MNRAKWTIGLLLLSGFFSITATLLLVAWPHTALAQPTTAAVRSAGMQGWGLVGAALAAGLSSLGAGIAVASVGSAAIGALAEKPELFGRVLILVGLAEGIAIYGLIVAVLIFNRL